MLLQGRKAAFVFSVLNIMNAIMGSGILALPAVLANNGIALFAILMFGIMGIADFAQLLVAAAAAVEQRSYEALGLAAFGYKGKLTVAISIMVQNTGANLSYLIVLGDLAPALFALFVGADAGAAALAAAPWWRSRDFLMAVGAAVFILPLACTRQIGFLGYASFASFAVMVCLAALAAVEFARIPCSAGRMRRTRRSPPRRRRRAHVAAVRRARARRRVWARHGARAADALLLLLCHTAFLPVLDELAAADALGRTARAAGRSAATAHVAIGLSGAIYLWTALWGYFTFGENVQSELWLSYNEAVPGDPLVTAVRFGFCISILCTVPLILFPMRKALTELLFAGKPFSWRSPPRAHRRAPRREDRPRDRAPGHPRRLRRRRRDVVRDARLRPPRHHLPALRARRREEPLHRRRRARAPRPRRRRRRPRHRRLRRDADGRGRVM